MPREQEGETADRINNEIDAVIAWVDGNDPKHIARKQAALAQERQRSLTAIPGGRTHTRFANTGELFYCIHAIRRFAPWFRTIYLVTDGQRPDFLDDTTRQKLGVEIIDHTTIFRGYEWALPTFNSRTIETALHRIPNLSERYVYFNDDFFILKPTTQDEFFSDNAVVLRGEWRSIEKFGPLRMLLSSLANHVSERFLGINRSMHILPQYRAAALAGLQERFLEVPHVPYPVIRTTLEDFFNRNPAVFQENIRYRFRDMHQYVTNPLAAYLEIAKGNYVKSEERDYVTVCFNRHSAQAVREKLAALETGNIRFLCLQALEQARESTFEQVTSLLNTRIFERTAADIPAGTPCSD